MTKPLKSKIDNIFTALANEKTPGAIMEFSLWCAMCFFALLSFIAVILVKGSNSAAGSYRILWIGLMMFQAGAAVLMAFRLKAISLLYASSAFSLIVLITYYATNAGMIKKAVGDVPGLVIGFFVFALMAGAGLTACSFIHCFSQMQLGKFLMILSIVSTALLGILVFCLYFAPGYDSERYNSTLGIDVEMFVHLYESKFYSYSAFWLGSISLLGSCIVTAVYHWFFYSGMIENNGDKIRLAGSSAMKGSSTPGMAGVPVQPAFTPGIRCLQGTYAGQSFFLQGGEISIGSGAGANIVLQDAYVSDKHCSIRYNPENGFYEILDLSMNGVYLADGTRLQKDVYNSCQRGSVACIGSTGQQFQLL